MPISSLCNDGGKLRETLNPFPGFPSERVSCRPNGEAAIGKETQRYGDVERGPTLQFPHWYIIEDPFIDNML